MSVRNLLLLIMAILIASGAVYFANSWLDSERAAIEAMRARGVEADPEVTHVMVASRNLQRGSFIKPEDIRWQAWPGETLDKAYIVKGQGVVEDFAGAVVRYPVMSGEPITAARIVKPGQQGFLAAVLQPGMRAITIPVNVTSGVAGFIFPGDRIDLLLTHRFRQSGGNRFATETLMSEVRVIAIDQRLSAAQEGAQVAKTITFEVSPKEAESITVARQLGAISLSLRSLAESEGSNDGEVKESEDKVAAVDQGEAAAAAAIAKAASQDPEAADKIGNEFIWDKEVSTILAARFNAKGVTVLRGTSAKRLSVANGAKEDEEAEEGENDEPADTESDAAAAQNQRGSE